MLHTHCSPQWRGPDCQRCQLPTHGSLNTVLHACQVNRLHLENRTELRSAYLGGASHLHRSALLLGLGWWNDESVTGHSETEQKEADKDVAGAEVEPSHLSRRGRCVLFAFRFLAVLCTAHVRRCVLLLLAVLDGLGRPSLRWCLLRRHTKQVNATERRCNTHTCLDCAEACCACYMASECPSRTLGRGEAWDASARRYRLAGGRPAPRYHCSTPPLRPPALGPGATAARHAHPSPRSPRPSPRSSPWP